MRSTGTTQLPQCAEYALAHLFRHTRQERRQLEVVAAEFGMDKPSMIECIAALIANGLIEIPSWDRLSGRVYYRLTEAGRSYVVSHGLLFRESAS